MEKRSLKYFVESCDGGLLGDAVPELEASGVSTDSRAIKPQELFIALSGERFNGHDFVADAFAKGAIAAVVENNWIEKIKKNNQQLPHGTYIVVQNTRKALTQIAARYRSEFKIPFIAVCGSNGKTTTKDIIASVLSVKFNTLKNIASFNNDIGVPLTLLNLNREHQVAVVEVGTNHPGELKPLLDIICPQFGIITSIGREHLEFFKSMETVVKEEGQLAECLPVDGKLFIHVNNQWAQKVLLRSRAPVITIGLGGTSNWRANVLLSSLHKVRFAVESFLTEYCGEYEVPLAGKHQAANALLAIAVGAEFGLSKEQIQTGLSTLKQPAMRMQIENWNGTWILNDAYNANPDSMTAALNWLSELQCNGKKIAVLGTMAELGEFTETEHIEIGKLAATLSIDILIAVGEYAPLLAKGAKDSTNKKIEVFLDIKDAANRLKQICSKDDILLVKASRSARLEQIINLLKS
ncbi:MAG: UDP-N-acetylmuramoyl-tripeptide--D-alanyl-D-alanine ligase [Verrucomicrobiae bacterium]|nr:UDP-N-acetylmuramoyl-tripeptide--D-alanyl-D-alanine ligase [Verrucomicrobiae bacterium]